LPFGGQLQQYFGHFLGVSFAVHSFVWLVGKAAMFPGRWKNLDSVFSEGNKEINCPSFEGAESAKADKLG